MILLEDPTITGTPMDKSSGNPGIFRRIVCAEVQAAVMAFSTPSKASINSMDTSRKSEVE